MNPRLPVLLVSLLAGLAAVPASAPEWKTTHLELKTAPLQRTTETAFEFTNTSDRPVTIKGVDSSCDCLDASASAPVIAPGASGRIQAKFTLGERSGLYRRTIIVTTDEAGPPVALTVELDVPEVATLTPRSLEWKLGGPAGEQTVEVTIAAGIEFGVDEFEPTSDAFTLRLETVEPGRRFRLHATPKSTQTAASAAFRLYGKVANGQNLVLSAYGNVR